jgi:hypothetical protein
LFDAFPCPSSKYQFEDANPDPPDEPMIDYFIGAVPWRITPSKAVFDDEDNAAYFYAAI